MIRLTARPPRGHKVIPLASFEALIWPECAAELPGPEGGYATTRVGSSRFAAWLPPTAAFRRAAEDVVGAVEGGRP